MSALTGLMRTLRGARKAELYLLIAALAVLALCLLNNGREESRSADMETRLEQALSCVEGAGKIQVMITEDTEGLPQGVLIVCEGADDLRVCLSLEQAVRTLLNVERSRIEIIRMKSR